MINIFKSTKIFFIGLIIFFACSLPFFGGGKPKIEKVTTTMRPLSRYEFKELIERVPTILNEALGQSFIDFEDGLKNDTAYKYALDLGLQEFCNPLLKRLFPKADFYSFQILYLTGSPRPRVLEAVLDYSLYEMPTNFNRLLVEQNLEVNYKNIVEFAKAFVIIAFEGQEVTFLEGERIKEIRGGTSYEARLKLRVGDNLEEWYFDIRYGQLGIVSRGNKKGLIEHYLLQILHEEK